VANSHAAAQLRAFESNRVVAGVSVSYHRGADSVTITAVPATTSMEAIDDAGSMVRLKVRDYLVKAADLVLDGIIVEPDRGDQIKEVIGSTRFVHEVLGPVGQQHFAWSSIDGSVLRVHTQEFEQEAVTTTTTTGAP